MILWCPVLCEAADGARYGLHWYYQRHSLGDWQRVEFQGGVERPGGRGNAPFVSVVPDLRFRDDNRRFLGGVLRFVTATGSERPVTVTPVSETGFHLGTGLYHGFDGKWHGQYRGELALEGEYIEDCSDPEVARRVHQHRDCVVRVEDPAAGATGWGNLQSIVTGPHPDMALAADASFM
jgi:hypothetical protein